MKRIVFILCMLVMARASASAQDQPVIPSWTPDEGYWVAESNAKQPKHYTIFFYNDEHVLIYKETIEGVKLNLDSRRVKKRLKKVLETSLWAWQKNHVPKENEGLVINLLQGK